MPFSIEQLWIGLRNKLLPARGPRSKSKRKRSRRTALQLEALEDRMVLSTLTVTSSLDDGSAGTLRSKINEASFDADNGFSDKIVFDTTKMASKTINLTQG